MHVSATPRKADWLNVRDAMHRVVQATRSLDSELVALAEALGRTLAADVISPIEHPPWDNSAMDGYAVRAHDVQGASADQPIRLQILERIPAGARPERTVEPGQATRIMTGAPLPAGADSVIRIEHVQEADDSILILDAQDAGRNIRPRGEDIARGATVLQRGRLLRAGEIGLLATIGVAHVPVFCRPRVAILSTGNELADLDQFEQVLSGRKIANSNSYALAAGVLATGAQPILLGIARDDESSLRDHLSRGSAADVLVTTAGASVGDHDLVKDVLAGSGYTLDFWRVRMRPGSPFSFGWRSTPHGEQPVFGLPGNPVSALVTFELFVRPALRRLQGRTNVYPPCLRVRTGERISSKSGLAHFQRVRMQRANDGMWDVRLTGAQGSGLVTSMAEAEALLVVPEERDGLEAGELAWAVRLAPGDDAASQIDF